MVKFITIRGTSALRATPYYIGIPQHERIMSRREAYELAATVLANNTTGAKPVSADSARFWVAAEMETP